MKYRRLIWSALFIGSLASVSVMAGANLFPKLYGEGISTNGHDIVEKDGFLYATLTQAVQPSVIRFIVEKMDSNGSTIWQTVIGPSQDHGINLSTPAYLHVQGPYVVMTYSELNPVGPIMTWDLVVTRLSKEDGSIVDKAKIDVTVSNQAVFASDVHVMENGDIYVAGSLHTYGYVCTFFCYQTLAELNPALFKFDGTDLSSSILYLNETMSKFRTLIQEEQGELFVTGEKEDCGGGLGCLRVYHINQSLFSVQNAYEAKLRFLNHLIREMGIVNGHDGSLGQQGGQPVMLFAFQTLDATVGSGDSFRCVKRLNVGNRGSTHATLTEIGNICDYVGVKHGGNFRTYSVTADASSNSRGGITLSYRDPTSYNPVQVNGAYVLEERDPATLEVTKRREVVPNLFQTHTLDLKKVARNKGQYFIIGHYIQPVLGLPAFGNPTGVILRSSLEIRDRSKKTNAKNKLQKIN